MGRVFIPLTLPLTLVFHPATAEIPHVSPKAGCMTSMFLRFGEHRVDFRVGGEFGGGVVGAAG